MRPEELEIMAPAGSFESLAAAEKVTGIAGYTVLKQFADDLVDRVR